MPDRPHLPPFAALRAFEADGELRAALGNDFSKAYVALKHAEWDNYCAHFSAWEHANTLDV